MEVFNHNKVKYSFRVRGYERREGLRLEVEEFPSPAHYFSYSWQLLEVSYAIDGFITFEGRPPYNPDYPMHQFIPDDLQVARGFKEHGPPDAVRKMLPYTWTYEHYDPRDYMRSRPLVSEYTNKLLVHPYFQPHEGNFEIRHAGGVLAQQFIDVEENSNDDNVRQRPQSLALALEGEAGAVVGDSALGYDYEVSDGSQGE